MNTTNGVNEENQPVIVDHGNGIYAILYSWRDAAWALGDFCKKFPKCQITAMMEEKRGSGGKITVVTTEKIPPHTLTALDIDYGPR